MLKGKLSHSKIYNGACSCGNKTGCSRTFLPIKNRTGSVRNYTSANQDLITKIEDGPKRYSRVFWTEQSNLRRFFDELGTKIGIQKTDDWYQKLSQTIFLQNGGRGFLAVHKNSPITALMTAYPEHNWILWKFNIVSRGYWNDLSNQRNFFDDLGLKLGVHSLDDWYQKLSQDVIKEHGGTRLLALYKGSPMTALMTVYPEHNWIPWKFNSVPRSFWKDPSNARRFFDDLGTQIGTQTLDDWYQKLSIDIMDANAGRGLLTWYEGSPLKALMAAYPEHNWIPWKFNNVSKGIWTSPKNTKDFLSELSEKLSIQTLDDWYRVDLAQLQLFGGSSVVRYKGLHNLLKEQYPHHPWDPKKFRQAGKKGQRWLAVTLKKMFPNEEILEDYLHPQALLPSSKRPMQLDVFIPSKSLAFEYQGRQHFEEVGIFQPTDTYQQRDEEKRNLCAANNIKLIEVPYWWNRTQESLQEMMSMA